MVLLRLWPQLRRGALLPHHPPWASSTTPAVFLHSGAPSLDRYRRSPPPPPLALLSGLDERSAGDALDAVVIQKKSKGQKKREALRGVDWALEFSDFSDSQLRRAIKWGDLQEEVFDAVKLVKKIGRDGKHARRRQLNLIGGMLRDVDPELMTSIIKAIKNGDVEGCFSKANASIDSPDEESEFEDASSKDEDWDQDSTVERWLEGLLSSDSDVLSEVYSIKSAHFNRQKLRSLVREASKNGDGNPRKEDEEDSEDLKKNGEPKEKLRDYLQSLIKLSNEN